MSHSLILPDYKDRIGVLYESAHFAVLNKPAGTPSHPVRDDGCVSIEEMLTPQQRGGPWLAHRLDRDTAGCLLIAKRKTALIEVQKLWLENSDKGLRKTYWAIVAGKPKQSSGLINNKLYKYRSSNGQWHMEVSLKKEAQPAKTQFSILKTFIHPSLGELSLLELNLLTGRTHQARVHCAELGTPIIGDAIYGSKVQLPYMALLAHSLEVHLNDETIKATATLPEYFLKILPK